jgi:mono/diheme cytochrome c family protein
MSPGLPLAALLATVCGILPAASGAAVPGNPVYDANCALCHQVGATGLPGQFPRLAGRVDRIAADPDGRRYLVTVVLNGMAGRLTVDGTDLMGVMPPFANLPDADIAAVLSYLVKPGAARKAIKPADVAAARADGALAPAAVLARRAVLAGRGLIP